MVACSLLLIAQVRVKKQGGKEGSEKIGYLICILKQVNKGKQNRQVN